ncbi:DNA primase [Sphingomonas sp.]|uniref:DNA primase n=1 Tax=Sphingomonas sp. TaxID=28214 RepID=UPI003AFF6C17
MTLTPAFLDELRARTSLSALIGRTTKLQKAGREMRGCCPFHNEKTPSFYVNDDKGFYHCFGCSAHGDAIRWMTDQRGLPFMDAVKELAAAAGMDVPAPDPRQAERQERAKSLHDVMQAAAEWFEQQLGGLEGAAARELLVRRGIDDRFRRAFGIGYAPDSRGKLRTALKEFGDAMLVEAGLLIQVEGKEPYDRFRGRLMIPIRDARGRVIAFGGRVIGDGEPKYLNSPDTPLFDKGRTLYNLDRAAPASRKAARVIVVEGYMDAIALARAGIDEAVAPLGTALTEAQLERLWRMVDVPILCFDGDAAGQKASLRAAHRALPMLQPGRSLAFATLPSGQDPDDLIVNSGSAKFSKLLEDPVSLPDYIWRAELGGVGPTPGPDERSALRERLLAKAESIANKGVRTEYRETFRKYFSDTFYPDRNGLRSLRRAVQASELKSRREPEYNLYKSILFGLMRHPSVILSHYEDIRLLPIVDRYQTVWRTRLVDIIFDFNDLSEDLVDSILSESDIAPIERRCYQKHLAFSFYRRSSSSSDAIRDLVRIIELLNEEHESRIAANLAHEVFKATMTEQAFAEQQRSRDDAAQFQQRLSQWLEAVHDADDAARRA